MADNAAFPTVGLRFDLNEIAQGAAALDELKAKYLEVGDAAEQAAARAQAAATSSQRAAPVAVAPQAAATAVSSSSNDQALAQARQIISQQGALWRQRAAAQAQAAQAGAQAEIAALSEAAAAEAAAVAQQMADEEVLQAFRMDVQVNRVRAEQAAVDETMAANAEAVAAQIADEQLLAQFRTDAQINAARQAAASAAEIAEASHAAALAQIADAELVAQMQMDAQVNAARTQAAALAAEKDAQIEASVAAIAQIDAEAEAMARAQGATLIDANAETTLARAKQQTAILSTQNVADLAQQAEATEAYIAALQRQAEAQGAVNAARATEAGASGDLAMAVEASRVDAAVNQEIAAFAKRAVAMEVSSTQVKALAAETGSSFVAEAAEVVAAIEAENAALNGLNIAAGGVAREFVVILREIARGDFSRLASSITILTQRMGLLGVILQALPWIAAAAAVAAFFYEVSAGASALDRLDNALALTGNTAGMTADSFHDMAVSISTGTGEAIGKVEANLQSLVASGKFTGDTIELLATSATEFGQRTGQSSDQVLKSFETMSDGATKWAATFSQQYAFITAEQFNYIQQLERQGDLEGAEKQTAQDLYDWLGTQAPQNLGYLAQAWNLLNDAVSATLDSMRQVGQQKSAGQMADSLRAQAAILRDQLQPGQTDDLQTTPDPLAQAKITSLEHQADLLQKIQDGQDDLAGDDADRTAAQKTAIANTQALTTQFDGLKHSAQLADEAIDLLHTRIQSLRDAGLTDSSSPVLAQYDADPAKMEAEIRQKYDRQPRPSHSLDSATVSINTLKADVASLFSQLDNINVDPVATAMQKVTQAYNDALAKFSAPSKQGDSQFQALAQTKALAEAEKALGDIGIKNTTELVKETDAQDKKNAVTEAAVQAYGQAAAIMATFYASGSNGSADYALALQAEAQAQLTAEDAAKARAIAELQGVSSIDQISQHYQDMARATAVAAGRSQSVIDDLVAKAKVAGDAVQAAAQNLADSDAAGDLAEAQQKASKTQQDAANAMAETTRQLQQQAQAYLLGANAVAEYQRQQAVAAAIKAAPAGPGQDAVGIANAQATQVLNNQLQQANVAMGKLVYDSTQETLQTTMTTQERAAYNVQLTLAAQLMAQSAVQANAQANALASAGIIGKDQVENYRQMLTITQSQALAATKVTAELEQQVNDASKLKVQIQDAIEQGFTETGTLDFSKFTTAIEQSIRKAIYDQLLAKPINIVVNATVNAIQNALSNSLLSGAGNSLGGMFSQGLSALGLGGSDTSLSQGISNLEASSNNLTSTTQDVGDNLSKTVFTTSQTSTNSITSSIGSLGSVLGGALAGITIGDTVGNLVGGNSTSVMGGAGLGGAGGAGIGFLLGGPVGALIGGLVGGVGGGLLGGLFSPPPSNNGASIYFNADGPTSVGGNKANTTTLADANSVSSAVQQTISGLSQYGIDATNIISKAIIGTRDQSQIYFNNGTSDMSAGAAGDTQALENSIGIALLQNAKYQDPKLQAMVDQMIAANDSLDSINSAIQGYAQAQTMISTLATNSMQYSDPFAYSLAQIAANMNSDQSTLNQDVNAGYLTGDQATTAQSDLNTDYAYQVQNALEGMSIAVDGTTHTLQEFQDAQQKIVSFVTSLNTGSLSALSPLDQVNSAQSQYQSDLALAQGGDYNALSNITNDAQSLLQAAQTYYGSGSNYTAIFQQVQAQLLALGTTNLPNVQQAIQTAEEDLVNAIGSSADQIVAALKALAPTATTASNQSGTGVANDNTDIVAAVNALNQTVAAAASVQAAATTTSGQQSSAALTQALAGLAALGGGRITGGTATKIVLA